MEEIENINAREASQTILQSIGYNFDSSFSDAMETRVASDRQILSCAGQALGPNQQFTMRFQDENVLINLKSLMFCCEVVCNVTPATAAPVNGANWVPLNALQFFQPQYVKIGNIQLTQANGDVFIQQMLELNNHNEIDELRESYLIQDESELSCIIGLTSAIAGNGTVAQSDATGGAYEGIIINYLARRAQENTGQRGALQTGFAASRSHLIAVRLIDLFPQLKQIPDMTLFTNHNSVLEFQIITTSAANALIPFTCSNLQAAIASNTTGITYSNTNTEASTIASPNYQMYNTCLFYQYARLDAPRLDIILKNEYMLQPYLASQYRVQAISSAINLTFPVSSAEKVHKLIFAFPCNQPKSINTFTAANPYQNKYSSPTNWFYNLPISLIDLTFMGQRVSIQSGQFSPALSQSAAVNDPLFENLGLSRSQMRNLRTVYCLNLSRLPIDFIGSSNSQSGLLTVQITLDASSYKYVMGFDYTTNLGQLDCYAFLLKSSPMYLRGGVYSFANK